MGVILSTAIARMFFFFSEKTSFVFILPVSSLTANLLVFPLTFMCAAMRDTRCFFFSYFIFTFPPSLLIAYVHKRAGYLVTNARCLKRKEKWKLRDCARRLAVSHVCCSRTLLLVLSHKMAVSTDTFLSLISTMLLFFPPFALLCWWIRDKFH